MSTPRPVGRVPEVCKVRRDVQIGNGVETLGKIRECAAANVCEVSFRGRISQAVRRADNAAH